MKIVIMVNKASLEQYTVPGDIAADWELIHLSSSQPSEDELIATNADAILIDPMQPLTARVIENMPNLKLVQSLGVGFNNIDLEAAKKAGVFVCNNAGVNAVAVAEQAILLMLAVLRHYREAEDMAWAGRQGEFKKQCFENALTELGDCHVGLIGLGAIAKETATRLNAFGCQISYYGPNRKPDDEKYNAVYRPLEDIYAQCDIVSLHMPVKPDTINMIDEKALRAMKDSAILINTGRGELVDQAALCRALTEGWIAGAGLDTFTPEPENPILHLPPEVRKKVALSPHIAGITTGNFNRAYKGAWRAMQAVSTGGRPANIVNGL